MDIHTVATEIPEHRKQLVANSELFKDALQGRRERKEIGASLVSDKNLRNPKSNRGRPSREKGEIGKNWTASYANEQPHRGARMDSILETIRWRYIHWVSRAKRDKIPNFPTKEKAKKRKTGNREWNSEMYLVMTTSSPQYWIALRQKTKGGKEFDLGSTDKQMGASICRRDGRRRMRIKFGKLPCPTQWACDRKEVMIAKRTRRGSVRGRGNSAKQKQRRPHNIATMQRNGKNCQSVISTK